MIVSFGEIGFVFALTVCLVALLSRKRSLKSRILLGFASVPIALAIAALLQEPWRSVGASKILSAKTIAGVDYALIQVWESSFENYHRFAYREKGGNWRVYHLSHEELYWRTAGICQTSPKTIQITRWGSPIAIFDIEAKTLVRLRDKARFSEPRENSEPW